MHHLYRSALTAAALVLPALAAPSARVRVDAKGSLRIPAATIKKLGVKPDRGGNIWVQFPAPPLPSASATIPKKPVKGVPATAPRILVPIDKGAALVPQTRLGHGVSVPGPAGTVYVASGSASVLVLKKQ
jgi:hypothetical protein